MTMTRRDFLTASAAFAATPVLYGQRCGSATAARGRHCRDRRRRRRHCRSAANHGGQPQGVVVEAASQIGGRCVTDSTSFEVPFDRGARWMHNPDTNPIIKLARAAGLEIVTAPSGQKIRIGRRNARAGETEDFLATLVRANRAIDDGSRRGRYVLRCGAAQGSRRLGRYRRFRARRQFRRQGPEGSFRGRQGARAATTTLVFACRQGLGTLMAKLGEQVPVVAVDAGKSHRLEQPRRHGGDARPARSPRVPRSSRYRATC